MGNSLPETKPWVLERIRAVRPRTILDVGAGSGTYANLLAERGWHGAIDAVEIWQPYVEEFDLASRYRAVYTMDIRDWRSFDYDLVIFGDVLEHMPAAEAQLVWQRAREQSRYGVLALPIVHFPQEALNGNPYEVHVEEDWSVERVLDAFPGITSYFTGTHTGAFWAPFALQRERLNLA